MKLMQVYRKYSSYVQKQGSFILLVTRLILAYGFAVPALNKAKNIHAVIDWFGELGIPFPSVNAWLAMITEQAGVLLLVLGLGTRLVSLPLIIVLLVAIGTVHWQNGFEAGNNGFEIPLYYMLMLLLLVVYGAGKYSMDYLLGRKRWRSLV